MATTIMDLGTCGDCREPLGRARSWFPCPECGRAVCDICSSACQRCKRMICSRCSKEDQCPYDFCMKKEATNATQPS